ncbi:hypothetical protein OAF89_01245 [bacterium]|nr:hypothetical protein [Akkermansiaceae bacterium]MDB4736857.1 hypothetical protein [bacterium]MDB4379067.1 hypothetical protein [Akkermansiaceae bacterium]MDB4436391.1 hypothetical protein [Akkermansiaceae bacterium]MDB4549081.1 hypothetical protein [Akkermansiaceae bacterium]
MSDSLRVPFHLPEDNPRSGARVSFPDHLLDQEDNPPKWDRPTRAKDADIQTPSHFEPKPRGKLYE